MSRPRQRERRATAAEVELWRQAVRDAAPLPGRSQARPSPSPPAPDAASPASVRPDAAPNPSRAAPGPRPHISRPLDRNALARLKKGRMEIEGRIDLHGMTAAVAERNLAAFLRASQAMGRRAVLVITGRGLDPQGLGRGVIKRETPHWLDRLPDLVAGYGVADRRHGGDGAFYVRLRRKDKAGRDNAGRDSAGRRPTGYSS